MFGDQRQYSLFAYFDASYDWDYIDDMYRSDRRKTHTGTPDNDDTGGVSLLGNGNGHSSKRTDSLNEAPPQTIAHNGLY